MNKRRPRVLLPTDLQKRGYSKFVQLYINKKPYLRTGIGFCRNILRKTLEEFGIEFDRYILKPEMKGKNYFVVGMGRIRKDKERVYTLSGISFDYELTPNKKHLEDLLPYLPEGIKLRIGEE